MKFSVSLKSRFQRFLTLMLCLGLLFVVGLDDGATALAASNTTAGQGEVVMPDWYPDDDRSLDDMIDKAGIENGSNDTSADRIGTDAEDPNLIGRAQQGLKETAESVKETAGEIRDRVGERIEKDKGALGKVTDRVLDQETPTYSRYE